MTDVLAGLVESATRLREEGAVGLAEAAKAAGVSVKTLYRWIHRGQHGRRLEAVYGAGRWETSHQAVARFRAHLTERQLGQSAPPPPPVPGQGKRALAAALARLRAMR